MLSSRTAAFVMCLTVFSAGCAERAADGQSNGNPLFDPDRERWFQHEQPWVKRDGRLICNGYLSRTESDRFCSAARPPDWQSFEYAGETFYVQPLARSRRGSESPRRSTEGR